MELNKSLSFKIYDLICEFKTLHNVDVKKEYVDGLREQSEIMENIPADVSISKQQKYIQEILLSEGDTICGLFINNKLVGTAGIQSFVNFLQYVDVLADSIAGIGIFIFNKNYRSMGLGKTLVWSSAHLFHNCTQSKWFGAGMAKENVASLKSFLACGFAQVYEDEESCRVLLNYSELIKPKFISEISIHEIGHPVK
jgi:hypothetical protein|tara:strand:+ start:173 stop:763 length:591 start_codon:yes stop_codon:yes gene_type:complete